MTLILLTKLNNSNMSPVTNVPHLTNSDVDLNMPADQNFNYYNVHDFHMNAPTSYPGLLRLLLSEALG